jgi:acetoin utilization protein AcuB
MTTHLVTVEPDDTIAHAANLLRQHQFHHLPVVQSVRRPHTEKTAYQSQPPLLLFQGLVTTQDIDMAVALARQETDSHLHTRPWQERRVAEIMSVPEVWVNPTTSAAAAAQLLVERGINAMPVIETDQEGNEQRPLLVGLLTRSDMLLAFARSLGAFEPGTQITIQLPTGQMAPLARVLLLADELHIGVCGLIAAPHQQHTPRSVSLRLSTINPGPLLVRLKREGISYLSGTLDEEGKRHD